MAKNYVIEARSQSVVFRCAVRDSEFPNGLSTIVRTWSLWRRKLGQVK